MTPPPMCVRRQHVNILLIKLIFICLCSQDRQIKFCLNWTLYYGTSLLFFSPWVSIQEKRADKPEMNTFESGENLFSSHDGLLCFLSPTDFSAHFNNGFGRNFFSCVQRSVAWSWMLKHSLLRSSLIISWIKFYLKIQIHRNFIFFWNLFRSFLSF